MLALDAVLLKGYATFKDVEFKITPGITYLFGLNKASGKNSKNRNGVGKSALVSAIQEILQEEPILGERSDRTEGDRTLRFRDNKGRALEVRRYPKGRGEKIELKRDGKEVKLRTPTIAKQELRRAFPLSTGDYKTYVHIDSRVPHPLVMGSSTERQKFFTSFFGLDKIDAERKLYTAELAKLKRTRAAFDELRAQYDKTKDNLLSDEKLAKYHKLDKKYASRITVLNEEIAQVQNVLRLIEFATNTKEDIVKLQDIFGGELSVEEFDKHWGEEKLNLKDAQSKLDDAEAYADYKKSRKAYDRAFEELSPRAKKIYDDYPAKEIRRRGNAILEGLAEARQQKADAEQWVHALKQRMSRDLPPNVKAPEEDEGDLLTLRKTYKHQLEHASKFKKGKCETCGQTVDVKDPAVLKKRLERVIAKLNLHEQNAAYVQAKDKRDADTKELKKQRAALEEAERIIADLTPKLKAFREVAALPERPKKFEGHKLEVDVCREMVDEVKDKLAMLKYMRPHLETVLEFLSMSKDDLKRARAAQALEQELQDVQERWTKVKTHIGVHETFKSQVQEMRTRLKKLKHELQDEEPLKHLVKAYQNKNLKKMAIEAISERLMVLVNRVAQQVMPERFTFDFKWDTKIRLLVTRHHKKRKKVSDVRKLSGAESTFFTLVLVCALLAFVPDSKRVNVLILDEPAARLSDELKEAFKNMLKVLNNLIPSIIVITPHQETYDGARYVTVVKGANGISTLVEAHPLTIK